MAQQLNTYAPEVTFHHAPAEGTKRIWKTFWLLLIITVIELGLGLLMYAIPGMSDFLKLLIKGVIVILTLAKAFYIIAVFMHLGDEIKNMIMTMAIPALLFIWFIAAFLWDGNSFRNLKNTYDPYHKERTTTPIDKKESKDHNEHDTQKPGDVQ